MAPGPGRRIEPEIDKENVRPAISVEIGDKDLTRVNGFGHLTGDYLRSTVDVKTSGLTKSDEGGTPRRADRVAKYHVRNPVTVEIAVTNLRKVGTRIPNRRQNGIAVDFIWNL